MSDPSLPLNVLVIEAYTDANVGSAALVENSIALLRRWRPGCKIRVMAHFPEAFRNSPDVDTVGDIFDYPYGRKRIRQIWWLCKTTVWMAAVAVQAVFAGRRRGVLYRSKVEPFVWRIS